MRKEKVRIVYMATSEMEASVRKNDVKTVGELLKKHGYKMFEDMELLHKAVNDLNFEMVRALVENGWDINQTNECEENVMFDIMCFIDFLLQKPGQLNKENVRLLKEKRLQYLLV